MNQSAQTGKRKKETEKSSSCSHALAVLGGGVGGSGRRVGEGPPPQSSPRGCSWPLDLLPV